MTKAEFQTLIDQKNWDAFFSNILTITGSLNSNKANKIIILSGRYNRLKDEAKEGIRPKQYLHVEMNRIQHEVGDWFAEIPGSVFKS